MRSLPAALFALTLAMLASPATAQVGIAEIKAQLFLERSGKLSDNIAGTGKAFRNTISGEGEAGEPADGVLVTLVLTGPKNTRSSTKIARDLVVVTVKQKARTGEKVLLSRPYGGFYFGETGRIQKAFMLDNATCAPLSIEVRVGKTSKATSLDFMCTEPAA